MVGVVYKVISLSNLNTVEVELSCGYDQYVFGSLAQDQNFASVVPKKNTLKPCNPDYPHSSG